MNRLQPLYDELRAYKRSRALAVTLQKGVLRALSGTTPCSCAEVAARCRVQEAWLTPLLSLLESLGIVSQRGGEYSLTEEGCAAAEDPALLAFAGYHLHCYDAWEALPEGVEGGGPCGGFHRQRIEDPGFCQAYLASMDAIARTNLEFLEAECTGLLSGDVLDVGAGPSTLCRRLAQRGRIRLTALDLPPVASMARALYGEPAGVRVIGGDFLTWHVDRRYDAAYCSHFLEYAPLGDTKQWLSRLRDVLQPGGRLVLVVFLRPTSGPSLPQLDLFELSTGLNGEALGHICTEPELVAALHGIGYDDIVVRPLPRGPSYAEFLLSCIS